MSLIKKKFLATGAVAKLLNNVFTTARNAANNADIELYKLNASDELEFNRGLIPSGNATESIGKPSNTWGVAYVASLKNSADDIILDIANATLHTTAGSAAVDADNRQLRDSGAANALTWEGLTMLAGKPLDMGTNAIKGVGSPSLSTDAATKGYVDTEISGIDLSGYIPTSQKGANNGVAELDAGGKVPVSQLPSSLMSYEGTWNASTNTPTLVDGTGDAGDVYIVSAAGTQDLGSGSFSYAIGDWIIYNGTIWQKSSNSNAVVSVNSQTGVVVLDSDDISEGATNKYAKTWAKESITLIAGDITNQYVDLAETIQASSLDLVVDGVMQTEGVDYTISLTGGAGGVTRLTFAGDLATAGASALVATDVLRIKYQY